MKPTRTEYHQAITGGERSRRAGYKPDRNPWANDNTERGLLLREAWQNGFERTDKGRRRR